MTAATLPFPAPGDICTARGFPGTLRVLARPRFVSLTDGAGVHEPAWCVEFEWLDGRKTPTGDPWYANVSLLMPVCWVPTPVAVKAKPRRKRSAFETRRDAFRRVATENGDRWNQYCHRLDFVAETLLPPTLRVKRLASPDDGMGDGQSWRPRAIEYVLHDSDAVYDGWGEPETVPIASLRCGPRLRDELDDETNAIEWMGDDEPPGRKVTDFDLIRYGRVLR